MCCHEHIYPVPESWGLIVFILNIIFPGWGTICQSYYAPAGYNSGTAMAGVGQILTAWLIVGWIWSIWHGYEVYKVSEAAKMAGGATVVVVEAPQGETVAVVE